MLDKHMPKERLLVWENGKRSFDKDTALGNLLAVSLLLPLFKRFANSVQTTV